MVYKKLDNVVCLPLFKAERKAGDYRLDLFTTLNLAFL